MEILDYDTLVYYATPPNNYVGSAIFLSYIVAALSATSAIVYSLYSQYNTIFNSTTSPHDEKLQAAKVARARHVKIYAFLASISFATLSYHMLMFLISHYIDWSGAKSLNLSQLSANDLKRWMLDSTLFQDFAQELVKDAPNAVWSQAAIVATWFWNIWMAQKARERRFDAQTMRSYILLGQILPISFTATLFIIKLHLSSPDVQPPTPTSKSTQAPANPARRKPIASLQLPNVLFNASLLALPTLRSHPIFSTLVLVERFILLLPQSRLVSLRDMEVVKSITVSGGFVIANAAMMRKELTFGAVKATLGEGGFAIKALGWDAMLGCLVYVVLGWGSGV
ncbi:Nn.00g084650.m01.CDS01 [Neocucurbitaria sp. VM-36]